MRRLCFAFTLLMAVISPLPVAAAAPATPAAVAGEPSVSLLMDKSGLRLAIRSFSGVVAQSLANPEQAAVSPQLAQRMAEKASIAFAPGFLDQEVRDSLGASLTPGEIQRLLAWHDTALGKRVTALEVARAQSQLLNADVPEDPAPATAARQRLLARIMKATNAVPMLVEVQMQVMAAMFRGMASSADIAGRPVDIAPILKELDAQRPVYLARVETDMRRDLRLTYAPLSDAELGRYAAFLESPLGRKFNRAMMKSLQGALTDAGQSFGELLLGTP
ncbi:MAG TPA: hypothetical protein VFW49_15775 [Fluviicoccus sp.]|nr:hypothetical protein [Fluviicoccus sp.]